MNIRFVVFASILAVLGLASTARAQMSDTERKSAARAAYTEGVKLQDDGKYAEALVRFEAAQKFFDAPTHLLHIAECQALTGRLVEASETYEALVRKSLPQGAPDAFVQAQQQGQAELPALRARVPTLRVTTKPDQAQLQGLQVNVNGVNMPVELLGIARPLNPGVYRFSAQAQGYATEKPIDVPLGEKEQKAIELTLVARQGGPVVVAAPPPPYGQQPPPYQPNPDRNQYVPRKSEDTTTPFGLLFGARGGAVVPAGKISGAVDMSTFASAGGGFGLDFYFRLAKMMLLGGKFDYGSLGTPSTIIGATGNFETSASTLHGAFAIGILPAPDKTSFIGDLGIGSRSFKYKRTQIGGAGNQNLDESVAGFAFDVGLGVSIPAGPIRIVPKADMSVGSFSSVSGRNANGVEASADILNKGTNLFFFVGIAIYGSVGFGGGKSDPAPSTASR
ncbi:MAG: hypothetical protein JST00_27265 [Deltaproteobacteria bacterium]|nr:hypothetical protein [Deltaproteobacteria bacterium]